MQLTKQNPAVHGGSINTETKTPERIAETPAVGLHGVVGRTVYELTAKGDSLCGWAFKMNGKYIFERREDAESDIARFTDACCDEKQIHCADRKTLKVEIVQRVLCSPNDQAELTAANKK